MTAHRPRERDDERRDRDTGAVAPDHLAVHGVAADGDRAAALAVSLLRDTDVLSAACTARTTRAAQTTVSSWAWPPR